MNMDEEEVIELVEICSGGVDEDMDLFVDCSDPDCSIDPACDVAEEEVEIIDQCNDGRDNDGDGLIDYYGTCTIGDNVYLCDGTKETAGPYKEGCYFIFEDSSEGYCDDIFEAVYSYDADCSDPLDDSESPIEICDDRIDNDGDGDIDKSGGCDVTADETIDYVCGCLDDTESIIEVYGGLSIVCEYGKGYGCFDLSSGSRTSGDTCGFGEDIDGIWYDADDNCIAGPMLAGALEESFFGKFWNWLMFWE